MNDDRLRDWLDGRCTYSDLRGYRRAEVDAIAEVGFWLLREGQHDRARTVFLGLVCLDAGSAEYYAGLGMAQRALGDWRAAHSAFARAHELEPVAAEHALAAAETAILAGARREAARWLRPLAESWGAPGLHARTLLSALPAEPSSAGEGGAA